MKFDKNKNKVIVTGGSGFVGSNTIKKLKAEGYNVLNYDIKEKYDICDYEQVKSVIEVGDRILHLAAIAKFNEADEDPLKAFEINVSGTENIAKAAKKKEADRVVYSSTGSVYMPISQEPPITENFNTSGNSTYGVSKHIGELMLKKYDSPYIILRYAHLYGEGKMESGAIGGFIDRMTRGLKPVLYGGKQSNDFTYIVDIVQANLLALESEHLNEVFNIGSGEELTTESVFEILRSVYGYEEEFEKLPQRTVDPMRFVFDISKAKRILGYEPEYNFKTGISKFKESLKVN